MTAPYKVDMATESVISHMAARIAALEAENAELKTRINDLATDWQVLRLKLETAREALKAWDCLIEYQFTGSSESMNALMNASQLGVEALAAIGEAQPTSAEVKSVPDGWQLVPKKITSEMIDAMCQQLGFSGAAVSSAYYDALAAAPTPAQQPRQESGIAAEALEEAAEEFPSVLRKMWAALEVQKWLLSRAAQKRGAGK